MVPAKMVPGIGDPLETVPETVVNPIVTPGRTVLPAV